MRRKETSNGRMMSWMLKQETKGAATKGAEDAAKVVRARITKADGTTVIIYRD